MATVFTKIINGEIPCHKIAETEEFIAFLDLRPLNIGHTLVVPKIEESYIFNLEDESLASLIIYAKKIAKAIEKAIPCKRIGVAVIGLEVPHTHIHLVPLNEVGDLNFDREKLNPTTSELEATALQITKQL